MTNLTTHPSAQSTRHSNAQNINTCPESISQEVEILPDSPIARRASGIRLPHDESPKDLDDLEELLKVDVNPDNPDTLLTNVITLIDTIFPDSKLPFLPSEELLNKLPCYNGHCQTWITPDLKERKQREVMLADFLNKVVADLEAITGRSALRNWDASFCNSPLLGSPIVRKPDVVLLDADRRHPVRWASVRAIAEITTQSREPKTISNTVTDKSYVILTTQPNRVFVPILSFWNDWQCRLTVTDRQGQLRSQVFELGTPWHAASCCQFLRLIIGFCFADKVVVGYDPTMKTDAKDKVEFISCDGKEFKVIKVLFEAQSLIGRATHVWLVEYEGRKYILKDAWVENSRPISEFTCLESLKGVQGVAQLFCGADVCVNGETLHTGLIRAGGWGNKKKFRVRRRIVLSTIGEHIATFSSKKELISAFRDITKTLKELSNEKDLVHRDISYNNILLRELEDGDPGHLRSGLLIDFEYAASRSRSRALAPGSRTGTAPFMAIELLLKKGGIRHTPQHDLESLFYVLLYLCTNLDGPGVIRSPAELNKHSTIPLSFWLQASSSLHQIGLHKAGTLADFETSILKCFSPYFVDLQPCVYNMCRAIYGDRKPGSPSNVSHDEIIKIFTDTLDTLAPEAALPNTYQPLLTSSPFDTRKRSLGIHDGRGRLGQKKLKSSGAETGDVESSETNWAVVSGHNTLTTSSNRGRRGHASTSQSGGRRSRRPAAHSR